VECERNRWNVRGTSGISRNVRGSGEDQENVKGTGVRRNVRETGGV